MNIVHITAGTGNFYCGTCLRDHALVDAMRRQGHDAIMVPLYLPMVTDTAVDGDVPLFYGGINAYLQHRFWLFRHTPRWFDRFWDSAPLLRAAAARIGMTDPHLLGTMTVDSLKGEAGNQAKEQARLVTWLKANTKPDVICLSHTLLSGLVPMLRRELGVPLVCSLQGEHSFLDALPAGSRDRSLDLLRTYARDMDAVVAPSRYYADLMGARLQIPEDLLHVVPNGVPIDDVIVTEPTTGTGRKVGYLAPIMPSKGLHILVDAFIALKKREHNADVQLAVAGTLTKNNRSYLEEMKAKLTAAGFEQDAVFFTDIDRAEKLRFLSTLSVFSVPATYGEAFGLYLLEAMAAGVPVVQPRHGAFPELIDAIGGGILCEADDAESLAAGLESLLSDTDAARSLGAAGREAVMENFTADHMAERFLRVLEKVI